jgi:hypothetical protein
MCLGQVYLCELWWKLHAYEFCEQEY